MKNKKIYYRCEIMQALLIEFSKETIEDLYYDNLLLFKGEYGWDEDYRYGFHRTALLKKNSIISELRRDYGSNGYSLEIDGENECYNIGIFKILNDKIIIVPLDNNTEYNYIVVYNKEIRKKLFSIVKKYIKYTTNIINKKYEKNT